MKVTSNKCNACRIYPKAINSSKTKKLIIIIMMMMMMIIIIIIITEVKS